MIDIQARGAASAEIRIFDPIGEDWIGNGMTAKRFDDELRALGAVTHIHVRINSPGGQVFDGLTIYNTLKDHPARVEVTVQGVAASIASVIAMAGDSIRMAGGAQLMIHNPWMLAAGDADDLRSAADVLDKVGGQLAEIYARRSGLSAARVAAIMDVETWLTADEAVELGFADESTADAVLPLTAAASAALSRFTRTPAKVYAMTTPSTVTPPGAADAILAAETNRRAEIRNLFVTFAGDHQVLLDQLLDDPKATPAIASQRLLAALAEQQVGTIAGSRVRATPPSGNDGLVPAAVDAICMRAGVAVVAPHAGARDLMHTSVLDIARACLSQSGRNHRLLSPTKTISAALSTSDFPSILENALGKVLRTGYEADPQSHAAWVKSTRVPDFKTQSRLLLGSAPALDTVIELGEYTYGSMSENKASLAVTKYGKALRLSWETLINDDLGAFMSIPQAMGAAARRKEADAVYAIFTANSYTGQTMQDSVVLFHTDHANLSATVGAISITTLGAGRTLLRKQQALGGGYMNLAPRYLIVAAEDETLAEQVLASATRHAVGVDTTVSSTTSTQKTDGVTPEWISKLQLVVEPRLDATKGFYLAAHHSQVDTVELATLEADGGAPVLEEEREFDRDAQGYKVRHVFVAKAIDWKGLVRVPKT